LGSVVLDIEPVILPSGKVGGEFVYEIFVAGLLTQLDAGAPATERFFDVGCGLIRKRKQKRSQWGSIPRKASQK
jgi:hypothetical protein